jgi:hypothetical protein
MKYQLSIKAILACTLFGGGVAAHSQIKVTEARIGCLDIQKSGNLTAIVARACNGKMSCSYKAPTPDQYKREGVTAATRSFCTQGMEITYQCTTGPAQVASVDGDAWTHPPAVLVCQAPPPPPPPLSPPGARLKGFVDLHTHPLSNLGFGGKLVYGGVDAGSLLPADPDCHHNVRATSMQQALGHDNSTHGGVNFINNTCGDYLRAAVIHATQQGTPGAADEPDDSSGAPNFPNWPVWNDITHQKMWVDWIRRAYVGGLRVMVALAVNNKTLGDMTAGPGDGPTDDKASADLQIAETKEFIGRHSDFMEIALTSADLQRIVWSNKLAVVLGVEIDDIGNLNTLGRPPGDAEIEAAIGHLFDEGVRYVFPVHLIDNQFGKTAAYEDIFNYSNRREAGHWWDLVCDPSISYHFGAQKAFQGFMANAGVIAKLGPGWDVTFNSTPNYPNCGQVNRFGLSAQGIEAIKDMMKRGMLIDIDHMSDKSKNETIEIAKSQSVGAGAGKIAGYPLNSGHAGLRDFFPPGAARSPGDVNERSMTAVQYQEIGALHGMAGIGSANSNAYEWIESYQHVIAAMGNPTAASSGAIGGFGTDTDGLAMGMPPRPGSRVQYSRSFPISSSGTKSWDYNKLGVAHYGMLPDFLADARTAPNGANLVDNNLMYGADYFFQTWKKCEALKTAVK